MARVNPDITPDLLYSIELSKQNQATASEEIATGRKLNQLSDDPSAAAELVQTNAQSSENDQFIQNTDDIQSRFQVADSTLNTAVQVMNSAISLAIEGSSGTVSSANQQAIAQQVLGLQQQMLSLANTSYQGTYLFAGTDVTTQPFAQGSSGAVVYNGNNSTASAQIANGQSVNLNVPGSQLFQNGSGSVFQSLNDLYNALQSGTGVSTAATEVQQAFDQLNSQRVFYGNVLNQLQANETFLNQESVNLTQEQTNIAGADITQAATDLSQSETAEQAVTAATAQILQMPTLMSYLQP
jgi:flagellar hook-associated protein 3 FlgL